jgi:hypothetical protein
MTEYQIERSIEQNAITLATSVFSKINRAHKESLKMSRRDRELVETRQMIWAYLKENTRLTMSYMGSIFNRHHSTVIAGLRVHNKNMDVFSNGKPINPLYVSKYEEGSVILDQALAHTREKNKSLVYRVVLYTNNTETLDKYEIVNITKV